MSSTFLWVSQLDIKLGSWDLIFKITMGKCVFENHAKSKVFQNHCRPVAFLASLKPDLRPFFLQLRFSVGRKITFPKCVFSLNLKGFLFCLHYGNPSRLIFFVP